MPETDTSAAQSESTTEQQSETDEGSTDWKAKAREWEKRAKDNMTRLKEAEPKIAEYDRLVQASKSELDLAREQATTYQERMQKAEREAMVNSVALEAGLTPAQVKRLNRDLTTREELLADAEELKSEFPAQQQDPREARAPRADPSQGSSARGGAAVGPAEELAAILQKSIRS